MTSQPPGSPRSLLNTGHAGDIEETISTILQSRALTVATAESCTGGLLAARLTEIPGSSKYFLGSIVAYSNDSKTQMLGIDQRILREHGAVSEIVAGEMCKAVRVRMGADLGVSITGIAGPGGGTVGKPVGTTFIGLCSAQRTDTWEYLLSGSRSDIRFAATQEAIRLISKVLQEANR